MQTANENRVQTEKEMIQNVVQSTASALQALEYFHRSLVQAKLPQSIGAYRTMCDTLVGQRIWMLDKEAPQVIRNFEALSQIATDINNILSPYVHHLDKLAGLGQDNANTHVELVDSDEQPTESEAELEQPVEAQTSVNKTDDAQNIVNILRKNKKRLSFTKIRSDSGLKRQVVQVQLDKLVNQGVVLSKKIGGRDMYEIATKG